MLHNIPQHKDKVIVLNNGKVMPTLGLGVYKIPPGIETEKAVSMALRIGYRLIDTAAFYRNEQSVGKAIRESGIPREDIFVTTKLFPLTVFGIEKAFYSSLKKLGLDYIDLYLMHWPFLRKEAIWKTFEKIYTRGHVKAIGVSNFAVKDIEVIMKEGIVLPAVNQVEFHPFLYRKDLLSYSNEKGITLEAHSPLTHGKMIGDVHIATIASHYGKSPAQLLIRWSLQHGLVVIPKATKEEHLRDNFNVFDFTISDIDMMAIDSLNHNVHISGLSKMVADPS